MNARIFKSKDFLSGLMFMFFGICAIWLSQSYPMGTARRMGPAYFPSIIGGLLTIFGFFISARSLSKRSDFISFPNFRPLLMIIGAVVMFALLLNSLGLILTLLLLVLISSLGGAQLRLREVAILYIILLSISVFFFIYGLGLQFSLWPS